MLPHPHQIQRISVLRCHASQQHLRCQTALVVTTLAMTMQALIRSSSAPTDKPLSVPPLSQCKVHRRRSRGRPPGGIALHTTRQVRLLKQPGSASWPTWEIQTSLVPLISMSPPRQGIAVLIACSAFGNSLSYVNPQGNRVAAESLPFQGTLDTSEAEIVVLSDKECDADCPYWRPDATSHCVLFYPLGLSRLTCARRLVRLFESLLH